MSRSKVKESESWESVRGRSRFFILFMGRHWFSIGGIRVLEVGSVEGLEGSNSVIKCLDFEVRSCLEEESSKVWEGLMELDLDDDFEEGRENDSFMVGENMSPNLVRFCLRITWVTV